MLDTQIVQETQGFAGEVSQFGMVPLTFQLCDHDNGKHHFVFVEPAECGRVCEQDRGVQDVRAPGGARRVTGHGRVGQCHAFSPGRLGSAPCLDWW